MSELEKAKALMDQAFKDLEMGCYDKAVSAAYFAVRMVASHLTRSRARRDDKVANALANFLGDEGKIKMMALYEMRKRADYREKFTSEGEAKIVLKEANDLFNLIIEEIKHKDKRIKFSSRAPK